MDFLLLMLNFEFILSSGNSDCRIPIALLHCVFICVVTISLGSRRTPRNFKEKYLFKYIRDKGKKKKSAQVGIEPTPPNKPQNLYK